MSTAPAVVHQHEPILKLQRFLDEIFADVKVRQVLDAGCGYSLPIDFSKSVRLIGLDVSAEALERNRNIDAGIVGDLATYPLSREEYDAVVCWNVLEHLAEPRTAIANMAGSLRPGGVLIVAIPNLWSLKGMITKLTPHRFHVWVYSRVLGIPDAGMPGFGPFPTYLRREIAPKPLEQCARAEKLERIYAATYRWPVVLPRALRIPWSALLMLCRALTLGAWDPAASEHIAVFRKLRTVD
ncbi:MAG: class I SAM-dependent methyltransferase [Actinobacteria bacterium]|nr:class I SAM-dependent methyltransferase [Actinomycetota bacterium]